MRPPMKVTLHEFGEGVPQRDLYRQGVDYQAYEFDLESEEAIALLGKLKTHRSSLYVETEIYGLDFYIDPDGSLGVEIMAADFWAISEIDLTVGAEIIKHALTGQAFMDVIPTTGREWDAYGWL